MKRMNFISRKEARRKEAKERNSAWSALTPPQQILSLDQRRVVAAKQRNKINKLI